MNDVLAPQCRNAEIDAERARCEPCPPPVQPVVEPAAPAGVEIATSELDRDDELDSDDEDGESLFPFF